MTHFQPGPHMVNKLPNYNEEVTKARKMAELLTGGIKGGTSKFYSEYLPPSSTAHPSPNSDAHVSAHQGQQSKKRKALRQAGGETWIDPTLEEWDEHDYRIFCGDLGNEVTDEVLQRAFCKYPSFIKAKVVRDKFSLKSRGYGFASFKNVEDFIAAMREMNGKYVGNRPIKLRKSTWQDRNIEVKSKKEAKSLLHPRKK